MRSQKRVLTIVDTPFFLRPLILALHCLIELCLKARTIRSSISLKRLKEIRNKYYGIGVPGFGLPSIQGARGFSLAEVLVAAGMLGGLSLVVMNLTSQQQNSMLHMETRTEESNLLNEIRTILLKKAACEQTFGGLQVGASVPELKDQAGLVRYSVGQEINNYVRIIEMNTLNRTVPAGGGRGDALFSVVLERMRSNTGGAKAPRPLELLLEVTADASGNIVECFQDSENLIETSKLEACINIGGNYIPEDNVCDLSAYGQVADDHYAVSTNFLEQALNELRTFVDSTYVNITGDTMTGDLVVQSDLTAQRLCVGANCRDFSVQSCAPGSVVREVRGDGTLVCDPLSCPANQFFAGLDSSGSSVCRPFPTNTCPTNQYVSEVRPDGTVQCELIPNNATATCPSGQVLQSINGGVPTCVTTVDTNVYGKLCPNNLALRGFDGAGNPVCQNFSFINPPTANAMYCIVMQSCPAGWTYRGRVGMIADYRDGFSYATCGSSIGTYGSDFNGEWGWCHPQLCCNY